MTDDTEKYILPAVPANPDTVGTAEPRVMAHRLTPERVRTLVIDLGVARNDIPKNDQCGKIFPKKKCSMNSFRYPCLVTTSSQSPNPG